MKPLVGLFLSMLVVGVAHAAGFSAVVTELERTHGVHSFRIDPTARTVMPGESSPEKAALVPINKYVAKPDRHFWAGATRLGRAEEILAQACIDGTDVLIVRIEHNSFSNPLKMFSAVSGHPIQVSEIWVVAIRGEKEVWSERLVSKDAVYRWSARLLK